MYIKSNQLQCKVLKGPSSYARWPSIGADQLAHPCCLPIQCVCMPTDQTAQMFRHLPTAKAQTSPCIHSLIRAFLFAVYFLQDPNISFRPTETALIRLHVFTSWSGWALTACTFFHAGTQLPFLGLNSYFWDFYFSTASLLLF